MVGLLSTLPLVARADRPAAMSAQTITLPTGPSGLKGLGESFSADLSNGSGKYSVPLVLPPSALTPDVSLSYAAGRGKSVAGLSWDVPVTQIYRTTDKGLPKFDDNIDRFAVSGPSFNDELVLVDAASRTYRLKNEGVFALFVHDVDNKRWKVRLPNGETMWLGGTPDSIEANQLGRYRWFISKHEDQFGHFITYKYSQAATPKYLDEIAYQQTASSDFQNSITFFRQPRPDVFTDYTYGAAVTTAERLSQIVVKQGANVVGNYELGYRDSVLFSVLTSVKATGQSGLSLPTITFDYVEPNALSGRFVQMANRPPHEGLLDGSAQLEDVNRDGLPDLLVGIAGNWHYYENVDGVSWRSQPTPLSSSPDVNLFDGDVVLADLNGDGARDVCDTQGGGFRYFAALGVQNGVFLGYARPAVSVTNSNIGIDLTARELKLSDVNLDGRVDLFWQKPGTDAVLMNVGDRLTSTDVPELPVDVELFNSEVELTDFNGDKILDYVRKQIAFSNSRIRVWYGLGKGRYSSAVSMGNVPRGENPDFFLEDVNHDGQTDLVRVSGSRVSYYLNNGRDAFTGVRGSYDGLPSTADAERVMFLDMNGNGTTDVVWLMSDGRFSYLDLVGEPFFGVLNRVDNGRGAVTDIAYRSSTDYAIDAKRAGTPWSTTLPVPVPVISEIVVRDSMPAEFGAWESRVSYTYGNGYYDGKEREFRGFERATSTEWGDDLGPGEYTHETLVTEVRMHVGKNLLSGADEEALKGKPYLKILKTRHQGVEEVYSTEETRWEQRWLCQEALKGVAQRILPMCANVPDRVKDKDLLVSVAVATATVGGAWEKKKAPVFTATETLYEVEKMPQPWMSDWARPRIKHHYGQVSFPAGRIPGTPIDFSKAVTTEGNDEVVTQTDFAYNIPGWLIGVRYSEVTRDPRKDVDLEKHRVYFDGPQEYVSLPLGEVGQGLETRSEVWVDRDDSWIVESRKVYNADGQVKAAVDANDNLTEYEYDSETRIHPTVERKFLEAGPVEARATYDRVFGAVTWSRDFNGGETSVTYDGLGRVTKVVDPLSTDAQPTVTHTYVEMPDLPLWRIESNLLVDRAAGKYRQMFRYVDGLGRTRLTKTQAEGDHKFIASSYLSLTPRGGTSLTYDSFSSPHAGFEKPPAQTPFVAHVMDALGRVVEARLPGTDDVNPGRIVKVYNPLEVREYDERRMAEPNAGEFETVTKFDAFGRAIEIRKKAEIHGAVEPLVWKTEYDALGHVVAFMDPAWTADPENAARDGRSKRSYVWDSVGRLRELTDPNLGHLTHTYDDVGNMKTRVDALGQLETWSYGLANRLTGRSFANDVNGKPNYEYKINYDEAAPDSPLTQQENLLGRVSSVEWPTGREHYSYDKLGRQTVTMAELWDPGSSGFADQHRQKFTRTQHFDAEGKVTAVELPNGFQRTGPVDEHGLRRQESLPGGFTVQSQYNERSMLSRVSAGPTGAVEPVIGNIRYDARGLITESSQGNGTLSCSKYDRRGQLIGIMSGKNTEVACQDLLTSMGKGFQHLRYHRTYNGNIDAITDLSKVVTDRDGNLAIPRLDASYGYDHLNQLISSSDVQGQFTFGYDHVQNLVSRMFQANATSSTTALPTGTFTYGENGAGPNMITSAGNKSMKYDRAGRLTSYNGYTLDYDVEGNLVSATKGTTVIRYYYDVWGERRITVAQRGTAPVEVNRSVFPEYELRNGDETWLVKGGGTTVEATKSKGVVIDDQLFLLEQLRNYASGKVRDPKPLPAEYMDFDNDGDFDAADVTIAETAFGSAERERLGGEKLIWRYYHRDQLTSTTHVTDSLGDLVNQEVYDVYGKKTRQKGLAPVRGFGGSELEVERELGLVRFGSRYYAPDLGRWITGDRSIGESPSRMLAKVLESNLYSYALNNPRMIFDPTGREGEAEKAAEAGSGAMDKAVAFLVKQASEGKITLKGDLAFTEKVDDTMEVTFTAGADLSVSNGKVNGTVNGSIAVVLKLPRDATGAYVRVETKADGKLTLQNGEWKLDFSGGVKVGKRYEPPNKMQGELPWGERASYDANAYFEAGFYAKGTLKWSSVKGGSARVEVGAYAVEGYSLGFGAWSVKNSSEKSVPIISGDWKLDSPKSRKEASGGQNYTEDAEVYGPPAPIMSIDPDLEACACSSQ